MGKLIIAKSNRGVPDPVGIHDSVDDTTPIDPAIQQKQDAMIALLQAIDENTDELELQVGNLEITTSAINLNTDDLEDLLQDIIDYLPILLDAVGTESGTNLLLELQNIVSKLTTTNTLLADVATEATLQIISDNVVDIETQLGTVITELQSIKSNTDKLDVDLSTRASESTLQEVLDTVGQESATTVLSRLQDIEDSVNRLEVSVEGELKVKTPSQLLFEDHFNGTLLDPQRWDLSEVGAGQITVLNSFCNLTNTTASGDKTEIYSSQSFLHIFSQSYSFRMGIILNERSLNNNIRIWGMRNITTNDGWYFRLNNGVLEACTEYNSVVTATNIDAYKPDNINLHRFDTIYRNYRILFYIDEVLVHTSLATTIPLYNDENLKVYVKNENTGTTTSSSIFVDGVGLFDDTSSSILVAGKDDDDMIRSVAVSTSRRLLVSNEPPTSPPDTTSVRETYSGDVGTTDDQFYLIPNGETLFIQRLSAGAEVDSTAGSVIELYYDVNGTGIGMILLDSIFASGNSDQHDLNENFVGDGISRMLLRRRRLTGGASEIFGRWEGYY